MASLDDYDEFGNYIGADLDSDDSDEVPESSFGRPAEPAGTLEGYDDDDPMQGTEENTLMQIDGLLSIFILDSLQC
jgi:U5 small nuclear ribonucleoprotein component